ncbi:MAG: hypothetical protein B2I18_02940 [Cuniculiplasma sp. C_DKE]|nr:MAG: hypothetical protein B2I18_02940 [Cuniculiplasma sp. C_DKE]
MNLLEIKVDTEEAYIFDNLMSFFVINSIEKYLILKARCLCFAYFYKKMYILNSAVSYNWEYHASNMLQKE